MLKVSTLHLIPGLTLAKDVYSAEDKLILIENSKLTDRAITILEFYDIPFVYVQDTDWDMVPYAEPVKEKSYAERIKQSPEFQKFSVEFQKDVDQFKSILNDVVEKNAPLDIDVLLSDILSLLDHARGSIHIFDMLHNLRQFDDLTYTHGLNVALILNLSVVLKLRPLSLLIHRVGFRTEYTF